MKGNKLPTLLALKSEIPQNHIVLDNLFRRIVSAEEKSYLPAEEIAEVLAAENKVGLVIGGVVDNFSNCLSLYKGDLTPITLPLEIFSEHGADLTDFEVIDCGHTLRFGAAEFSVDGILYEFDSEYRKLINKNRKKTEKTFGASLRRLRLQKGLRQCDFAPHLSEKHVRRLENSELDPTDAAMKKLAKILRVKPEEIATY